MLITHSIKLNRTRAKNAGLIANTKPINGFLSNADALPYSRLYWAAPNNAADYKTAKEAAVTAVFVPDHFPSTVSAFEAQLYLRNGGSHILHTPTMGCALVDAINKLFTPSAVQGWRGYEGSTISDRKKNLGVWIKMESNPVAIANHGEIAAAWKGGVKALVAMRHKCIPASVLLQAPSYKTGLRDTGFMHAYSEGLYLPCGLAHKPVYWQYKQTDDRYYSDVMP